MARPLWRGDHVPIKQLIEDFGRYLYLPRLADSKVLLDAIADGLGLLTWERETFAYADSYDEAEHRYRGLRHGQRIPITDGSTGLLVKSDVAARQLVAEEAARRGSDRTGVIVVDTGRGGGDGKTTDTTVSLPPPQPAQPKRFHGSVTLDATRVGRDAGRIADEVISHLAGLVGSDVFVTLEIAAEVKSGVPDKVVHTVTENCRTLKFKDHGFEES